MLTLDQKCTLVDFGGAFYVFAFAPLLLAALARRHAKKSRWWLDISLTVVASWVVISTYRLFVERPVDLEYAYSRGDFMSDGVGENVATIFVVGWLFPLVECIIVRLGFFVAGRLNAPQA